MARLPPYFYARCIRLRLTKASAPIRSAKVRAQETAELTTKDQSDYGGIRSSPRLADCECLPTTSAHPWECTDTVQSSPRPSVEYPAPIASRFDKALCPASEKEKIRDDRAR